MGLNLHLDMLNNISPTVQVTDKDLWIQLADMRHTTVVVDRAEYQIKAILTKDREMRNAIDTLKKVKNIINTYGANEALFCVINENGSLGSVLNMHIPMIDATNATQIGTACCENIDVTVEDANAKLKEFFTNIAEAVTKYIDKLKEKTTAQIDTLTTLTEKKLCNCKDELTSQPEGYSYPIFMSRLNALTYISDNLASVECTKDAIEAFTPHLKVLGVTPTIKSFENAEDPEVAVEPTEQPVEEPLTPKPEGDPDEVVSTEEPSLVATAWNVDNIKTAVGSTLALVNATPNIYPIAEKIESIKQTALESLAIPPAEGTDGPPLVDKCRNLASFIVDIAMVYNSSSTDIVDQIIAIASNIVKEDDAKCCDTPPAPAPVAEPVVPAEAPTVNEPVPAEQPQEPVAVKPWFMEEEEPPAENLNPDEAPAEQEPTNEEAPAEEPPAEQPQEPEEPQPENIANVLGVSLF